MTYRDSHPSRLESVAVRRARGITRCRLHLPAKRNRILSNIEYSPIAVQTASSVDRLRNQFIDRIGDGQLPNGDEGADTVHGDRPLIFDSVAALDVCFFSFLKQVASRGQPKSHVHRHFSTMPTSRS